MSTYSISGQRVLLLSESGVDSTGVVNIDLKQGLPKQTAGEFYGLMTLNNSSDHANNGKTVDVIEADYVDGQSATLGVSVHITFTDNNTFATVKGNVMASTLPSHVQASILSDSGNKTVVMTFTKPDSDQAPVPTDLLFNTGTGVKVDPSVVVRRRPL